MRFGCVQRTLYKGVVEFLIEIGLILMQPFGDGSSFCDDGSENSVHESPKEQNLT